MADLRAEQIAAAILTKVTGLTTTGANVKRARAYPWGEGELPALSIYQGADIPLGDTESNIAFIDSILTITIAAHVFNSSVIDTVLNQIRKEVYSVIMVDRTLGLSFVHRTDWAGQGETEINDTGAKPVGTMPMEWRIFYRHSITDASA